MRTPLTLWVQVDGTLISTAVVLPNLFRAKLAADAILIKRPEVEAVEVHGAKQILHRVERSEFDGWLK